MYGQSIANWDGSLSQPRNEQPALTTSPTTTAVQSSSTLADPLTWSTTIPFSSISATPSNGEVMGEMDDREKHEEEDGVQQFYARQRVGHSSIDASLVLASGNAVFGRETPLNKQSPLLGIGPAKITFTPSSTTNVAQTGHTAGTETVTKHDVTSPMQEPTSNPDIAEEAQITNGMEASADMDVFVTRLGAVADLLETSSADAEGEDDIDEIIVDEMLEYAPTSPVRAGGIQSKAYALPSPRHYPERHNHSTTQSLPLALFASPPSSAPTSAPASPSYLFTPPPSSARHLFTPSPSPGYSRPFPARAISLFTPSPPSHASRRLVLSHIAVPDFPHGWTKADYRPLPPIPIRISSQKNRQSRPQVQVYQNVGDALSASLNHNGSDSVPPRSSSVARRKPGPKPKPRISRGSSDAVAGSSSAETIGSGMKRKYKRRTKDEDVEDGTHPGSGSGVKRKYTRRIGDKDDDDSSARKKARLPVEKRLDPTPKSKPVDKNGDSPHTTYDADSDVLRLYFRAVPVTTHTALMINTRFLGKSDDLFGSGIEYLDTKPNLKAGMLKAADREEGSWFVWPPRRNLEEGHEWESDDDDVSVGPPVRGWDESVDGDVESEVDEEVRQKEKERIKEKISLQKSVEQKGTTGGDGKEKQQVQAVEPLRPSPIKSRPRPRPKHRQVSPQIVPETETEGEEEEEPKVDAARGFEIGRPSAKVLGKQKAKDTINPTGDASASRMSSPLSSNASLDASMDASAHAGMEMEMDQYIHGFGQDPAESPHRASVQPLAYPNESSSGFDALSASHAMIAQGLDVLPGLVTSNGQCHDAMDSVSGSQFRNESSPYGSPPKINHVALHSYSESDRLATDHSPFLTGPGSPPMNGADPKVMYGESMINPWMFNGGSRSHSSREDSPAGYGDGTIDPTLLGGINPVEMKVQQPSPPPSPSSSQSSVPLQTVVAARKDPNGHNVDTSSSHISSSYSLRARRHKTAPHIPHDMVVTDDLDLSASDPDDDMETSNFESDNEDEYEPEESPQPVKTVHPSRSNGGQPSFEQAIKDKPDSPANNSVKADLDKLRGPRVAWPMGEDSSSCHQCRTGSNKLKMICACGKKYCVRCITLRYNGIVVFDASPAHFVCPACNKSCNCDICTRRRGEVYVSARPAPKLPSVPPPTRPKRTEGMLDVHERSRPRLGGKTNLPPPTLTITGPVTYWATIYGISGEKVGTAFVGGDGNEDVVVARPIRDDACQPNGQRKRVFIGSVQPSWGLGPNHVVEDLTPIYNFSTGKGKSRAADVSTVRSYIGKKRLLFAPSAPIEIQEEALSSSLPSAECQWLGNDDGVESSYSQWVFGDSDFGGTAEDGTAWLSNMETSALADTEVATAIQRGLSSIGVWAEFPS